MHFRLLLTVYTLFLLSGARVVNAQDQHRIDSIRRVIKESPADSVTAEALISMGDEYQNSNPDLALSYYLRAMKISKSIGFRKVEALAYNNSAIIYYMMGFPERGVLK